MKRGLIILLLVFFIPSIIAVEVTFSKTDYQPQETLQAEIIGNFLSLTEENIQIYKDDKVHPEPVVSGLTKQDRIYYFYAVLPNQEGNFTLRIKDAEYYDRGRINNEAVERTLTIIYKNSSYLSINPGFIIPKQDFIIKAKSLNRNTETTAVFQATEESKPLSLIEGIEESLTFRLPELPPQKSEITIGDYRIPVFLTKKSDVFSSGPTIEFIPERFEARILRDKTYDFTVILKNSGPKNLTNLKLSSDLESLKILILPESIKSGETKSINLSITLSKPLSGEIRAEADNQTFLLPVVFILTDFENETYVSDPIINKSNNTVIVKKKSCSTIGIICEDNQVCNGETTESLEGPCCIGDCITEKKSSLSNIIGIILIIILILIVIYIIWKVRQRRKESPRDILNKRAERYNQRMKPRTNHEIQGSLDKI